MHNLAHYSAIAFLVSCALGAFFAFGGMFNGKGPSAGAAAIILIVICAGLAAISAVLLAALTLLS